MFSRTLVSAVALLSAGCATVQDLDPRTPVTPTPTCNGAADCEAKWSAARSYIVTHVSYQLQNDSVDRLETYNPREDVTAGLRAQASRALQPDGSYAIVAKFWCNNLIQCSPDAARTLNDFNSTVAAAGSGAAVPHSVPVAAATSVAAVPPSSVASSPPAANQPAPPANAEKYIRDSEAAWSESASTHDASVVRRLLADDCVWIFEGRTMDKAGAIAAATKGSGDLVSNHLEQVTVRFFGDMAIAQGSDAWTRQGGKTGHVVWTHTWTHRNGQWQIVAAQDTVIDTESR